MEIIINCTRCHGTGLFENQLCPDCNGAGYKVVDKKSCDHAEYDTKQVIDFKFNVCRKCGYQWKCAEGGGNYEKTNCKIFRK